MNAGTTEPTAPRRPPPARPDPSRSRLLDGVGPVGRVALATAAIGGAFILGTIVLRVAGGDLRDPIALAAVPDLAAAQGTGDGFHEVEGARIDRLAPTTDAGGSTTSGATSDGVVGPTPSTGGSGSPTTPTSGSRSPSTPGAPGGPQVTVPGVTTPAVTTPSVTTPSVSLPPVTLPTVSVPPVSLPPIGSPLPPPPTVALPTISVPPITLPEIEPTLPVTVPTLPPVTLPPLFPNAETP